MDAGKEKAVISEWHKCRTFWELLGSISVAQQSQTERIRLLFATVMQQLQYLILDDWFETFFYQLNITCIFDECFVKQSFFQSILRVYSNFCYIGA